MGGRRLPWSPSRPPPVGQTHRGQETPWGLIQARALMLLPLFCGEGERALSGCGRRIASEGREGKAEEEGLRVEVESRILAEAFFNARGERMRRRENLRDTARVGGRRGAAKETLG